MGAILSFKHFFKPRQKPLSYKHRHFLNALAPERLDEILVYSEGDTLATQLAAVRGKKVLFCNDQKHKYALKKTAQAEPAQLINFVYQGRELTKQKQDYWTIQGELSNPPLRKGYFEYALCPFVLIQDLRVLQKIIGVISAQMANGQRVLVSVRHPALDQILLNQNPATTVVSDFSIAKVFEILKQNHLFTENLTEGHVDLTLKPYFTENEHDYYHEYKNTPLCAVFTAVKFERKS